jgi:uncharacterized peroxidase-related enzyme
MTWIKTIEYSEATGSLLKLYDQVKGPDNNVDNIMQAHSLRPHTMQAHMTIYKYVLHHPNNSIETWFLECIGIYVSMLNHCNYCIEHHFSGLSRLMDNQDKADAIKQELLSGIHYILDDKQIIALDYAKTLTLYPSALNSEILNAMRELNWSDGEILEINQVAAYFNYANRTVLGLGVNTKGDEIGLSPSNSNDIDDWNHS